MTLRGLDAKGRRGVQAGLTAHLQEKIEEEGLVCLDISDTGAAGAFPGGPKAHLFVEARRLASVRVHDGVVPLGPAVLVVRVKFSHQPVAVVAATGHGHGQDRVTATAAAAANTAAVSAVPAVGCCHGGGGGGSGAVGAVGVGVGAVGVGGAGGDRGGGGGGIVGVCPFHLSQPLACLVCTCGERRVER